MRSLITMIFLLSTWVPTFGQLQRSVYDTATREPIAGVRVSHQGQVLTLTDHQGLFSVSEINSADS